MNTLFLKTKKSVFLLLFTGLCMTSCNGFLDVVPDNVFQYEDLYVSQRQAMHALAGISYAVPIDNRDIHSMMLGDDWVVVNPTVDASRTSNQGASIMRGNQSATNTLMSYWTGHNTSGINLYNMIRNCDMFIQSIDLVPDMTVELKADWKAQAKFYKAYYLFMLIKGYGPIIIPKIVDPGELNSDLFLYRSKVEDCFDYIINLIDEAIPFLRGKTNASDLGMADQVVAKAIKARILVLRASPFYNGNADYYSNFLDHNGEHFFAQTEDREKWKIAAEAAQDALDACEQWGYRLYHFNARPYDYDMDDFANNPERMQTLYDLRFRYAEPWNEETIWGMNRVMTNNMSSLAAIRKPPSYGGPAPSYDGGGFGGASYQAMERYYTEHGLPLNEDRTVNPNTLHEIINTPDINSPDYAPLQGYMQPDQRTIRMYMNREPRFYADLGITGGYYRAFQVRINLMMFQGTDGGYSAGIQGENYNSSGIAVQKTVHPEDYYVSVYTQRAAPLPIIRVADLYLMKAEALNEYYGPSDEVYAAIDAIRTRAGIPTVAESYSNSEWVTDEALNKHLTKEGMREIILRERANEFAFEFGHRFWDMQRWKRSVTELSRPLMGWNFLGPTPVTFFNQTTVQGRNWTITDCLWPIDDREMERNNKLIQNPGW